MHDFREVVRQRIMLIKVGAATKSVEETADDIIAMVVEECAKIAQDSWGSPAGAAAEIRKLTPKK